VLGDRGDIEIAFGLLDCKKIVALLEVASQTQTEYILAHRFLNLDGGEEATILAWRQDNEMEIALDRSDEGMKRIRLPLSGVAQIIDAVKIVLRSAESEVFEPNV
jgi:hypothetical protein